MKESKSFGLNGPKSAPSSFLDDYVSNDPKVQEPKQVVNPESVTRQTFMIKESQLTKLKDFVHTKKKYHDYEYSQRQALEEALTLLFRTVENIESYQPKDK